MHAHISWSLRKVKAVVQPNDEWNRQKQKISWRLSCPVWMTVGIVFRYEALPSFCFPIVGNRSFWMIILSTLKIGICLPICIIILNLELFIEEEQIFFKRWKQCMPRSDCFFRSIVFTYSQFYISFTVIHYSKYLKEHSEYFYIVLVWIKLFMTKTGKYHIYSARLLSPEWLQIT